MNVDLIQFSSLFEIGVALHFAVAFLERIYSRELPVRLQRIAARAQSLKRLKEELIEAELQPNGIGISPRIQLTYRVIDKPIWNPHNEHALDLLSALRQESTGPMKALQQVLSVITLLSVVVILYSVTTLFMIGLELPIVRDLSPMTASAIVLLQLLPLPLATAIFFFVARRMSSEVDRKLRGIGEHQLILSDPDSSELPAYASVEEIYQRDMRRDSAGIYSELKNI